MKRRIETRIEKIEKEVERLYPGFTEKEKKTLVELTMKCRIEQRKEVKGN